MRHRIAATISLAALLFAAPPAHADDAASEQARPLFDAGKQAYDAGNFPAAIQAFESAYKISPRPGIVFSIAQAHRRQYYIDKRPEHIHDAIKSYRDYIERVPEGGRRGEAAQALAELEPVADRLTQAPAAPKLETKPATWLMVPAKIQGATISVDNGKPQPMPLFAEVKPGKHTLRVIADGYFPEDRDVEMHEGLPVSLDIQLREMPGRLEIRGVAGAQVTIDGRLTGALPLPKPLEVTPGTHFVAITKSGYKSFSEELEINRGQTKPIAVKSGLTGQRIFSYVLFGVGVAGVAGAIGLGLVSGGKQQRALAISGPAATMGGLSQADFKAYEDLKKARDYFQGLSSAAATVGVLGGAIGFLLYVFDQPAVPVPRAKPEDKRKTPAPAPKDTPMELTASTTLGPGLYGASLIGRF
jgi:hypothetical protein